MSEPCPSLLAAPSSCTDQGRSPETATGAWRLAPGASMRVWPGRPAIEIGRGPAEKANQPAVYPVKAFLRPPPKFVRMASIQELKFQARRLYKEVSPRPPRLPLRSPHTVVTPHPEPSSLNMTPSPLRSCTSSHATTPTPNTRSTRSCTAVSSPTSAPMRPSSGPGSLRPPLSRKVRARSKELARHRQRNPS